MNSDELLTLQTEYAELCDALARLVNFSKQLCEDVGVSTHQHSIENAERLLDKYGPTRWPVAHAADKGEK